MDLPEPGGTDEEDELASLDVQGHAVQRRSGAARVDLGDVLESDHDARGARFGDGRTAAGLVESRQRTRGCPTVTRRCPPVSTPVGADCGRMSGRQLPGEQPGDLVAPLPEGARGVLQDVGERHLRSTHELRVRAQVGAHQQRLLPDRPERARVRRRQRRLHRRVQRAERPAQHHHARVEDVDQARQPEPHPLPRLAHARDAAPVPDGHVAEHVLDVGLARVPPHRPDDRGVADLGLPAPARTARADRARRA